MSINPLNDISRVYLEQVSVNEAKQSFPFKKVEGKMKEKFAKSVWAKKGNPAVPNTTDDEKKATTQHSKMFRTYEKEKRAKQEVDKARRSSTFYKDTHPASAPKMKKANEEFEIDEAVKGADPEMRKAAAVERKEGDKRLAPSKGKGYADQQKQSIAYMDKLTKKNKNVVGLVAKEALDPVGQEDADIDNDGDTDKSDKYLHKRRKAIGKAIAKKKSVKEGFSNWRQDLAEVMDDTEASKKIKEKKVNNKIKINPKLNEAVEEIGGTLLEMVEIEGVLDELSDEELLFLSDTLIEEVVEEFFIECLEEGYDIEEVEEYLIESLETSAVLLDEAKVTLGHDTKIKSDRLEKVKSAVKTAGRAAARGAGYVAGLAKRAGTAAKREFKAGYEKGKGGSSASSSTSSASSGLSSSSDKPKRPGLLARIGSKLKSGLRKAVASGARSISRGARNVARKVEGGETKKAEAPKAAPKKAEKPSDPWEGSATTPPKTKAKAKPKKPAAAKPAAPKAKAPARKKKSKLDDLLASVRSEEVEMIDEKTLTKMEMKKREEIVKSMKDKTADFEKRYPGRGKEVMYATATKMAKRVAEQMDTEMSSAPAIDKKKEMLDKQKLANLKMLQQKKQQLDRQKLQMQKSGKLPLDAN